MVCFDNHLRERQIERVRLSCTASWVLSIPPSYYLARELHSCAPAGANYNMRKLGTAPSFIVWTDHKNLSYLCNVKKYLASMLVVFFRLFWLFSNPSPRFPQWNTRCTLLSVFCSFRASTTSPDFVSLLHCGSCILTSWGESPQGTMDWPWPWPWLQSSQLFLCPGFFSLLSSAVGTFLPPHLPSRVPTNPVFPAANVLVALEGSRRQLLLVMCGKRKVF